MGRGFVLREPSVAACDDQLPTFSPLRKWSRLPSIECRTMRHLSSKNRAHKAHSDVLRGQHEKYSISGQTGSPDHQNSQRWPVSIELMIRAPLVVLATSHCRGPFGESGQRFPQEQHSAGPHFRNPVSPTIVLSKRTPPVTYKLRRRHFRRRKP